MQNNNKKIGESPDQKQQEKPQKKNSDARIRANAKYNRKTYKQIKINVRPEQAEKIRESAQQHNFSLAQLIIKAVTEYNINHTDNTAESTEDTATAESRAEKAESTESPTTEDTAEQIPEYIKNMIDRSKAYDKDFSEKQRAKRKVERERAKAEYNLID